MYTPLHGGNKTASQFFGTSLQRISHESFQIEHSAGIIGSALSDKGDEHRHGVDT